MATLNIGGRRVTVDDSFMSLSADEQNAAVEEIAASLPPAEAPKAEAAGSSAAGMAKAVGVGAAKGAIGVAGIPGDVSNLINSGMAWAEKKIRGETDEQASQREAKIAEARSQAPNILPGSSDIRGAVEGVTGEFYKPQGVAEEYAQTVGEFLPAMVGGPGSFGTKLATRVAAPALASETAGQLTKDTAYEPYARVGGAVLGGLGAGAIASARQAPGKAVPSADDLLKTGSRGFEAVKKSGATIDPNDAAIIADGIKNKIFREGARPASQPALFSELDRLESLAKTGKPISMGDMESVRKAINDLKMSPDGAMRTHARAAVKELMDLQTIVLPQNVSVTLKDAIGNWAAGKRSNTVMGKAALADLNAATAGAGGNLDNASRQAIKQLVRPINNDIVPKAQRLGFNAAEIEQMNKAARGTVTGNTARLIGKAAPTGIVSGSLSGGAGFAMGGPVGAIALPAVGMVAKKIGDMSTQRAITTLDSLVRSRSPLAAQVAQQLPQVTQQLSPSTQALLNSLLASQSARAQPVQQPAQGGGY